MNPLPTWSLLAALATSIASAHAAQIDCAGVLGNSGSGATLVRFGAQTVRSLGPVEDRFGTLWDRAGEGTLLRFAADGRMLARYRIPPDADWYHDRAVIAGDLVVMLIKGELWSLRIDAAPDSAATSLGEHAEALAPTAVHGRVAIADAKAMAWFDPATRTRTAAGPGFPELMDVEAGADGSIYALSRGAIHRVRDGAEVTDGWPQGMPGERPQLIDGCWYGTSWASTIRRHDATMAPAPGVVLGGNTGAFLGHVHEYPDIVNGRGLAHLGDGSWAVGNLMGGITLLDWDARKKQFTAQRRISALPDVRSLGLDAKGRVMVSSDWYVASGWWAWDDAADAPLRESLGMSGGNNYQLAPIGGDVFVSCGHWCTGGRLRVGEAPAWREVFPAENKVDVPRATTGVAAIPIADGRLLLLSVTGDGATSGWTMTPQGPPTVALGAVALTMRQPALTGWTSLALDAKGRVLAAVGGWVVVFAAQGPGWDEVERWNSWGTAAADHFGASIWIQADRGRLWVSDHDRHRVLRFDGASRKPDASFGVLDHAGDDLGHLDGPGMIAPYGDRCVVHDGGNQRLVKLIVH